jgi:hypothetical protein
MDYVLLRYHGEPADIVDFATTNDPARAVELALRWSRSDAHDRPIIHCQPRSH